MSFLNKIFENPEAQNPKKENDSLLTGCFIEDIKVEGGVAKTYDYSPNSGHLKSEIPLIVAPGCGGTEALYHEDIREFVDAFGRRVITLDHPKRHKHAQSVTSKIGEIKVKARNILDIIHQKNLEKVDIVAHSRGAIDAILAASEHPEYIRNIVLVAPAGFMKDDSFRKLALRFAQNIFSRRPDSLAHIPLSEQEKKLASWSFKIETILHCVYGNLLNILEEIKEIAESHVYEKLGALKEHGVKIIIIAPVDDKVFPIGKLQEMVRSQDINGFLSVVGEHGSFPRITKFAEAIGGMLDTLEGKEEPLPE